MTTTYHDEFLRDRAAMLALRGLLALQPSLVFGPEARPGFDELMARTPPADGVETTPAIVGGVAGWWCRPGDVTTDGVILYHHGGAYVLGSAAAYRNFVGQIASRAGMAAFVADYALAPEHPFPAAFDDAMAVYRGLLAEGHRRIVLGGDSAGGGLTLALLAAIAADDGLSCKPLAAVVVSPWIDLSLSGDSIESRAKADPLLNRDQLVQAAALYLRDADPGDPRASALAARRTGLPPVQIHVGEDEILLDDAVRYTAAVEASGGSVDLHIWRGMIHVFAANVSVLSAAGDALDLVGTFTRSHC